MNARYISICLPAERGYFSTQSPEISVQGAAFTLLPILSSLPFPVSKMTLPSFTSFPQQQKEITTDSLLRNPSSAKEEEKGD